MPLWPQVLFLVEPVDEVAITSLATYKDFKFVDVSKEDLDLGTTLVHHQRHPLCTL